MLSGDEKEAFTFRLIAVMIYDLLRPCCCWYSSSFSSIMSMNMTSCEQLRQPTHWQNLDFMQFENSVDNVQSMSEKKMFSYPDWHAFLQMWYEFG